MIPGTIIYIYCRISDFVMLAGSRSTELMKERNTASFTVEFMPASAKVRCLNS